jgi:hypothetical protein
MEQKLYPCKPDDELRCQGDGTGAEGQCRFLSISGMKRDDLIGDQVPDSNKCPKHGGTEIKLKEQRRLHDYELGIWQTRLDNLAESSNVKNLRGEIGILRLLMERTLTSCTDPTTLMISAPRLADLAVKLEKVVSSCDRLETKAGLILDEQGAIRFAISVSNIIKKYLPDTADIKNVLSEINQALLEATNEK